MLASLICFTIRTIAENTARELAIHSAMPHSRPGPAVREAPLSISETRKAAR